MNSRLFNFTAVIVAVAVVATGMMIYNSSQNSISNAMDSLSAQEIMAFNHQFDSYGEEQAGSQIKALMGRLIGNADTYRDECTKVPFVVIDQINADTDEITEVTCYSEEDVTDYISELGKIRNKVETKHEYWVDFTYQDDGIIDYIIISYDPENVYDYQYNR